jgi:PII-like signaling protein
MIAAALGSAASYRGLGADSGTAAVTAGCSLCFYLREADRHGRMHLSRWLLRQAFDLGLPGGTATRTHMGFGRSGYYHDTRFVDLCVNLAVRVEFLLTDREAEQFLESLRPVHPNLIYQLSSAEYGVTG